MQDQIRAAYKLLTDWQTHAEQYWYSHPARAGVGCYGTGYNNWGVQTNQKYVGGMAALAAAPEAAVPAAVRELAQARAVAALRFSLATHVSGALPCLDGSQWGHTWISTLGLERMMFALPLLDAGLDADDHAAIQRVLVSEADWIMTSFRRGKQTGVVGGRWAHAGSNAPESNIWVGAFLWRTASMLPDHADAAAWRQRGHAYLMNGVSVAADASDARLVAGTAVRDWFRGDNFFPNYALDHHGYLNVGYMVICLSNAAMLHFDLKLANLPAPESLHHHQADLWERVRQFLFADGRLLRLGGDSRLRYTYCQEYLLPTLLYAADQLGDTEALKYLAPILGWVQQEAAYNHDGGFYSRRLASMATLSPYYYTRLEADRACVLGMLTTYLPACKPTAATAPAPSQYQWQEPEHGASMHRCPTRIASFAWRAHALTQGMCLGSNDSHLAEWDRNLCSCVRFVGEDSQAPQKHRSVLWHRQQSFDGGFLTVGCVEEGRNLAVPEGWQRQAATAQHWVAFAALPDGHTVVGLEFCRTAADIRAWLAEVRGLHANVANDLFNDYRRQLSGHELEHTLAPIDCDQVVPLGRSRVCVDNRLALFGIYGADQLVVDRSANRRGGLYKSLFVDEICYGHCRGPVAVEPGSTVLDSGWAVAASTDTATMLAMTAEPLGGLPEAVRAVRIGSQQGSFIVAAGWGSSPELAAQLPGTLHTAVLIGEDAWAAILRA